ncbi:hypothetical protein JQN63_11450 [Delftia lacustris]|uniref:hypothetical protein n=1 Tax=Delftia lacustris TaxID=558537 RepID=UPI00193C66D8|nr:hypothetical protein [Delftia lacustris]QRI92454.1 hypothetical protein JQN63_11000 [Delftia lacustris]QRI92526.1 hypothetical protein JQN63_11450 [Delftia lacustris]
MTLRSIEEFFKEYVYQVPVGGEIKFTENGLGGEGSTFFQTTAHAVVIKAPKRPPSVWALKCRRFSEGSFLTVDLETKKTGLHILEMKSKLTGDELSSVLEQFKGMYLASLGVIGILNLPHPDTVQCYLAYKELDLGKSQPIFLKTTVGGGVPAGISAWHNGKVRLPHGVTGSLIKKTRIDGNAHFEVT